MKNNNSKFMYILLILTIVLLVLISIYFYIDKNNVEKELNMKISQIQDLNNTISDLRQEEITSSQTIIKYAKQIAFMDKYVAICPLDGNSLYHKYTCEHYDKTDSFYIYSIPDAKEHSFSACYYCKNDEEVKPDNSKVVFVTDTGSKYHRDWCSYLNDSKKEITLEKAKEMGYSSCSRCNP